MNVISFLLYMVGIAQAYATIQLDGVFSGHCTKEGQDSLDWRVKNSEVIATGTVTHIEYGGHDIDAENIIEQTLHQPHRQAVGLVQLWRVMKGTIEHVTNFTYGSQENQRYIGADAPVIKLHGLWNDHVCGSFLSVGDTRIFFLQKLLDARPNSYSSVNETTSLEARKSADLSVSIPSDVERGDAVASAPAERRIKKKHRKKGNKKGRKRGRKGRRKGQRKRKGKRSGKRRLRKRKTTESTYQSLLKLTRRTKYQMTPLTLTQMKKLPIVKVKRSTNEQKDILIVTSAPARITLKNLNDIEAIVELQ